MTFTLCPRSRPGCLAARRKALSIRCSKYPLHQMNIQMIGQYTRVYLCIIFLLTLVPYSNGVLFISEFRKAVFRVLSNLSFIYLPSFAKPQSTLTRSWILKKSSPLMDYLLGVMFFQVYDLDTLITNDDKDELTTT